MEDKKAEQAFRKLRDILNMPKSKTSMDILKIWYSNEDVKLLMAGPFKAIQVDRYSIEEYSEAANIAVDKVKETFERLARRGVLFWYYDSKEVNKKKYLIPPLFPGLFEYFTISPNNSIDERRRFVKKFHSSDEVGFAGEMDFSIFRIIPGLKPEPEIRLVEIDQTLSPDKSKVLAYQDVEEIIKQAGKTENNMAVVPCTCRTMAMMTKSSPDCEGSIENCMTFGPPAKYSVEEGIGRYITIDEGLEILKQSEKEGLIHLTQNTKDKHSFICNCCTCCCGIVGAAIEMRFTDIFQESDYVPVIDYDECTRCKKCVKYCKLHALLYKEGEKPDKSDHSISIRENICIGCGVCASNCPTGAMNLKKVRDNLPANSFVEAMQRMNQSMTLDR